MNIARRDSTPVSTYRRGSIDEQLGRMVETMFEDMLSPLATFPVVSLAFTEGSVSPRMDVSESEQGYDIQAELPGIDKNNVKISIDGRRVSIEAEQQDEQKSGSGNTVYTERSIRKYARSFMLPVEVDDASAQAKLENGILTLNLPKKEASQSKRISVQ